MNANLLETLMGLRIDPSLALALYRQLFAGRYWVLVQKPVVNIRHMSFLTYPTRDNIRELPVFTGSGRGLLLRFTSELTDAAIVEISGEQLWPRMLDIIKTGECEVAIDPGEEYSIRLTREMILGMVKKYGAKQESPESLIEALVGSLVMRDWEEGIEPDPVNYRKSLTRKIVEQGEAAVAPLLELLQHEDWAVRDHVALMLGYIKDNRAIAPLLRLMNTDESRSVQLCAAEALECIGTQETRHAANQWYTANNISPQTRLNHKLGNLSVYWENDTELTNRLAELARRRGVSLWDVIGAFFEHGLHDSSTLHSTIRLSPEECQYIEELYMA